MKAIERSSLVVEAERRLLRWLVFENAGGMGVLPSIDRVAIMFGVGKGVVREAIKRLESVGLVIASKGARYQIVPPEIAFSLDTIPAMYRAAPSSAERLRVMKTWASMKWLVALEAFTEACGVQDEGSLENLKLALTDLVLISRQGEVQSEIVEQEVFTIWQATKLSTNAALLPAMNGLVRCIRPLREVWPVICDEERSRDFAVSVQEHLENRDVEKTRAAVVASRSAELTLLEEVKLYLPGAPPPTLVDEYVRDCFGEEVTIPSRPAWSEH